MIFDEYDQTLKRFNDSSSSRRAWLMHLMCACVALGSWSCANVRFEKSPYAVRGFDVVYSRQEDVTFLVWRLRSSAAPDRVTFELYQSGDYRPIELGDALFPAEPYECEEFYLCFQYQLPGRYTWPDEIERPLRSIHEDEGLYAGSEPRVKFAEITFGIDPIALGRNTSIDPRRLDWFELESIPMRRAYQWQLTESERVSYLTESNNVGDCIAPDEGDWSEMEERVNPGDIAWVEQPMCMAARPRRRDGLGVMRNVPFPPSPMLAGEQQDYVPREERPPVVYLYLADTLIKSTSRCERALNGITGRIDRNFGSRAPNSVRLGVFTPLDPQLGRPLSGCEQRADQDYPVRQMLEVIKQAAAELDPQRVRLVIVYLNNVDLPPSDRVANQLDEFFFELTTIQNIIPYAYAIGSNLVLELFEWHATLGWQPIDDEIFIEDIKTWGDTTLPFRTMLHEPNTPIRINKPVPAENTPQRFKICAITPEVLSFIGLPASRQLTPPIYDNYVWPTGDNPEYLVDLIPQVLIPNSDYVRTQVSVEIETCERFCDHPFRTASGRDLLSWEGTEKCQWR